MNLFETMAKNPLYTDQMELAAIWLPYSVATGEGNTHRIAPNATVYIEDGKLAHVTANTPATHKVIMCMGTLINQFELTLINLITNEPTQIKIL